MAGLIVCRRYGSDGCSMSSQRTITAFVFVLITAVPVLTGCSDNQPRPGTVLDEAMRAKRTAATFPAADEDYFHDMDGGAAAHDRSEIQGRNMWIVWTGGNDRLWDVLARESLGSLDFLKTLSSHPTLPYSRDTPLELSRPRQRALLHEGDRSRPEPLRAVARRARSGVPAGSVRERRRSTRACRSARAARPCRSAPTTASRRASSACGCSRTRTSTRRRGRKWDSERYYRDPELLRVARSREAVPRRHVVRVLPRRARIR